ncbi:electron transfer flavoprotein beta subunit/FixA family protein [Actinomycetaceae bacterium L2_0104]
MAVVVAYKYAANPQDATVGADGVVDWSRTKATVSEYDPVAIQVGRNVADAAGVEVVGISIGGSSVASSMAKKSAMAKGLDRGIVVADDAVADWNTTKAASALAALVERVEDADLLITGDASIDDGSRMTSALIAGFLGWPCFQEVMDVEKTDEGYAITQMIDGGTRKIEVSGPVVVATAPDAVVPKSPSMKDILAAGKKPVETLTMDELDPVNVSVSVAGQAKPETTVRKKQVFTGPDAVGQLVAALRADGVL